MGTLLQDLRYGLRMLAKNPGFTAVAVLTLALGIGANTTVFSVMNATLLRPLPFPDADRLVLVWETSGKGHDNWNAVSAPNFWDFERQSKSFEGIAIFDAGRGYNLSPTGTKHEAEQVPGLRVSAGFFSVLGWKPFLGRTFLPEEETLGKDHEVLLSHGLWKRRYGGDPTLVGRTILIDGQDFHGGRCDASRISLSVLEPDSTLGTDGLYQDGLRPRRERLCRHCTPPAGRNDSSGTGGDANHRESPGTAVPQRGRGDGHVGRTPG